MSPQISQKFVSIREIRGQNLSEPDLLRTKNTDRPIGSIRVFSYLGFLNQVSCWDRWLQIIRGIRGKNIFRLAVEDF